MNIPTLDEHDLIMAKIRYYLGGRILLLYISYKQVIKAYNHRLSLTLRLIFNAFPATLEFSDGTKSTAGSRYEVYLKGLNYLTSRIVDYGSIQHSEHSLVPFFNMNVDIFGLTVLVVGAFHGEDAIRYAKSGASKVIAYEPFPFSYTIAAKNIDVAGLNGRITLINCGIGIKREITLPEDYESGPGDDTARNFRSGRNIQVIPLKTAVDNLDSNDLFLSMNCEGCEYDAICQERDETLRRFKYMHIEYHYGCVPLVEKLRRAGFEVNFTRPRYNVNKYTKRNSEMLMGSLYAIRKTTLIADE